MAQDAPIRGRIGLLSGGDDVTFLFNPKDVKRNRRATYAGVNAALADFPNTKRGQYQPVEWIRNESEDISIDLYFYKFGNETVEQYLRKLDEFMRPEPNSGQPPDLVFQMGARTDRVRILEKDVNETLFTPDTLEVQEARVSLKLKCLTSRSSGGG